MSTLLKQAMSWSHSNLSLYVDDSTIYTMSTTEQATTTTTTKKYKIIL